jgi:predicted N-acetyltransferase YhbS
MQADVTIRPMTAADVPEAQALTASFGWPHRREDWALMQALGRGLVAEQQGKLVGTALAWCYGADWASLGAIGVCAELQGQGIGRRLLRGLMEELGERRLVLHATREGMRLYAAEGFVPTGSVVQHQGVASRPAPKPLLRGLRLCPAGLRDLRAIAALDRAACGMDRTELLAQLLEQPGGVTLEEDGAITGFALLRLFGRGRVIGPVAALDGGRARAMIALLLDRHIGQFLRIDVPRESGLGVFLVAAGLTEAGTVMRMVRGTAAPSKRAVHTFSLASQALG